MALRGENLRFWIPVGLLLLLEAYSGQKLIRSHVDPEVTAPRYDFQRKVPARRGAICSSCGKDYPYVKSIPIWEYRLDPVALTNGVVRRKGELPRPREAIVKTISTALGLDYRKVKEMANAPAKKGWRSQKLAESPDPDVYRILADSTLVRGVAISGKQDRRYLHGRSLSHVLGSLNAEGDPSSGIEIRFNRELKGTPGVIQGKKDAHGHELYDKRVVSLDPVPGSDVHLTIEPNVQFETEHWLKWGVGEYGAAYGWCVVMDSRTGAIIAMASLPDFDPLAYGTATDDQKINRAIAFNYEPGSVMKVITASAAIDSNPRRYGANTVFRTNRDDPGYYKLPGDGSHVWEPTMTLKDAIVHSSNIVIGKLAYDLGPKTLYGYMKRFGFGAKTGIELPGEQYGILPNPAKRMWDKASWSRAGIGQFVAVTAIQLASAYQAIANDGKRVRPYLVERVVDSHGTESFRHEHEVLGQAISPQTAKKVRGMMLGVASPEGTARRAAIRGYSVAGKTGTAQKQIPGGKGYYAGLYRASFCGIVPSGTVDGHDPRLVVLVSLDFNARTTYHQGGNSAGPVFKRIAMAALRYLRIPPDRPDELEEASEEDDEFNKLLDQRVQRYGNEAE